MDNIDKLTDRLVDITNKLETAIGAKGPAMVEAYVSAVWAEGVVGTLMSGFGFALAASLTYLAWRVRRDRRGEPNPILMFPAMAAVFAAGVSCATMTASLPLVLAPTGYALRRLLEG